MYGHSSPQPIVTTTSAHSHVVGVEPVRTRSARRRSRSRRITSTTSGWTCSAGRLPADARHAGPRRRARTGPGDLASGRRCGCRRTARCSCRLSGSGGSPSARRNWYMTAATAAPSSGAAGRPRSPCSRRRDGRAERAGGVHRRARDRAAEHRVQADGAADRDRRRLADGAGVGGDGHDHEHQEQRQHRPPTGTPDRRFRTEASRRHGRRCRASRGAAAPPRVPPSAGRPSRAPTRGHGKWRQKANASVTAGLKWAPEMRPRA